MKHLMQNTIRDDKFVCIYRGLRLVFLEVYYEKSYMVFVERVFLFNCCCCLRCCNGSLVVFICIFLITCLWPSCGWIWTCNWLQWFLFQAILVVEKEQNVGLRLTVAILTSNTLTIIVERFSLYLQGIKTLKMLLV